MSRRPQNESEYRAYKAMDSMDIDKLNRGEKKGDVRFHIFFNQQGETCSYEDFLGAWPESEEAQEILMRKLKKPLWDWLAEQKICAWKLTKMFREM